MNRLAITFAALAFSLPAMAQQAPSLSPGVVCGQLRAGDTTQLLALAAEIERLQGELKALKAEAVKPKDTPAK